MSDTSEEIDYGPLTALIGTWQGNKGTDIAPEPDGIETNPYYETITFEAIGDVVNADEQTLVILHYTQIVSRKSNDEVFHHQSGYWTWDAATGAITHSFSIPRGVAVVAGGNALEQDGSTTLTVAASQDSDITQSAFMGHKAKTTAFNQTLTVCDDTLSYMQSTMLKIYGRTFEHTDSNTLMRQSQP